MRFGSSKSSCERWSDTHVGVVLWCITHWVVLDYWVNKYMKHNHNYIKQPRMTSNILNHTHNISYEFNWIHMKLNEHPWNIKYIWLILGSKLSWMFLIRSDCSWLVFYYSPCLAPFMLTCTYLYPCWFFTERRSPCF